MGKELKEILNNFFGFNSDMLYNQLILLDKSSQFNKDESSKFALLFALFKLGQLNIEELNKILEHGSLLNPEKVNKITQTILSSYPDWIGFSSKEVSGNHMLKIYLSVDNSDLHMFINKFLKACLEHEYDDYDFKINNKESINRRDNIVIYCNESNFGKYIALIEKVLTDNPDIKFNQSHLLGIRYNDQILCALEPDDGNTSYTDQLCQWIFNALKRGFKVEDIVEKVTMKQLKMEPTIRLLAEQTKKLT